MSKHIHTHTHTGQSQSLNLPWQNLLKDGVVADKRGYSPGAGKESVSQRTAQDVIASYVRIVIGGIGEEITTLMTV